MSTDFKYKLINVSPILPEVYGKTLSFYEYLCKIAKRVDWLTSYINDGFIPHLTALLNHYIRDYVNTNVKYTEDDKGLHFNLDCVIISGDHKYNADDKSMEIVTAESLTGGEPDARR